MSSSTKNTTTPVASLQTSAGNPQVIASTLPGSQSSNDDLFPLSNVIPASDSSSVSTILDSEDVPHRKRKAPGVDDTAAINVKRVKITKGEKIGMLVTTYNVPTLVYQGEPIVLDGQVYEVSLQRDDSLVLQRHEWACNKKQLVAEAIKERDRIISLRQADIDALKEEARSLSDSIQESGNNLDDNLNRLGNTLQMIGVHNKTIEDQKNMCTIRVEAEITKTTVSATLLPGISQCIPFCKDPYIVWCPMLHKCQESPKVTEDVVKTVKTVNIPTAKAYKWGIGTNADEKEAFRLTKIRADDGHQESQLAVGDCYNQGRGVEQDKQKALEYYNLSANQGYPLAYVYLGRLYLNGNSVVEKNPARAYFYFKRAADGGTALGQFYLAYCYDTGCGVQKDYKEAFRLYKSSSEEGCMLSTSSLAECYLKGHGVQRDLERGSHLLRIAANDGIPGAMYNLAVCYESGRVCTKNLERAHHW